MHGFATPVRWQKSFHVRRFGVTSGTVSDRRISIMLLSMRHKSMTLEQNLLNLSGLMAIAVVAAVNLADGLLWPDSAVFAAFAAAFLVAAYDEELGFNPVVGRLTLAAQLPLSMVALALNPDTLTLILSVVMVAGAPYHYSARSCWLLMIVANTAYWLILRERAGHQDFGVSFVTLLALQGFAISSSLARQREVSTRELLARKNSELLAARALMSRQSQAEERLRIAGDLHDTIGHRLTALRLQLEALSHEAPAALRPAVMQCQSLAADLLEDIRAIVRRMSEEQRGDLSATIIQLAALTPGVEVVIETPLPALPVPVSQQLVFCVQEGINNAIRHGAATQITIAWEDNALHISDNGKGLRGPAPAPGFGLDNIDKRLAPFGGHSALSAASDLGGCELTLQLAPEAVG